MIVSESGWVVFDGDLTIIDGPFQRCDDAETAAGSHRYADPLSNTVVAYADLCPCDDVSPCPHGCGRFGGLLIDMWQDWHYSDPEEAA